MQINKARLDAWNHELILEIENPNEAGDFVNSFAAGNFEISRIKEKRSNTANSYAWLLLTKIAAKRHISAIEAYKHEIQDLGGIYDTVYISAGAIDDFSRSFKDGHIGRFVDLIGVDDNGWAELLVTYGSSDFNRSQMAAFIDGIVQECEILGIETKPQEYVDSLLNAYDETR